MKRNLLKNWRPGDDKAGSGAGAKIGDILPPWPAPPGETHTPKTDGIWKVGADVEKLDRALEAVERGADPYRVIDGLRDKASHRHMFATDQGEE